MTERMNPEIKSRWTAALRSGEYPQTRGVLRDQNDCFCGLGVLCDLAAQDGICDWVSDDDCYLAATGVGVYLEARSGTLPEFVVRWAGLDREDPYIGDLSVAQRSRHHVR